MPLTCFDSSGRFTAVRQLLDLYGISIEPCADDASIIGSYWGESEAGVAWQQDRLRLYLRRDTPLHSVLHEAAHMVCMTPDRRVRLFRDAGGEFIEESAVCYLQILWADLLPGTGRDRLMQDMDDWGYSFRLGSTREWFEKDAEDARVWLLERGLITATNEPTGRLNAFADSGADGVSDLRIDRLRQPAR